MSRRPESASRATDAAGRIARRALLLAGGLVGAVLGLVIGVLAWLFGAGAAGFLLCLIGGTIIGWLLARGAIVYRWRIVWLALTWIVGRLFPASRLAMVLASAVAARSRGARR